MYQPVTVVTPQGQVVTQALSPGTIRIQNSQVRCLLDGLVVSRLGRVQWGWLSGLLLVTVICCQVASGCFVSFHASSLLLWKSVKFRSV